MKTEEVKINGNPLDLIGVLEAENRCIKSMDGTEKIQACQHAGSITLQDNRIVNLSVYAYVDAERTKKLKERLKKKKESEEKKTDPF